VGPAVHAPKPIDKVKVAAPAARQRTGFDMFHSSRILPIGGNRGDSVVAINVGVQSRNENLARIVRLDSDSREFASLR
jgi:hypothetical protein